jgi:hypothetical protein
LAQINMDNGNRRNVEKIPPPPGPLAPGPGLPPPRFQHVAPDGARTAYRWATATSAKLPFYPALNQNSTGNQLTLN